VDTWLLLWEMDWMDWMAYPDNLDLDGVELFVIFGWRTSPTL
jgi:hypothetical protein